MSKLVFGVPLENLIEQDRKKHPELRIPYVAQASINLIIRDGFDCEGIFRISGNKEKVAMLKDSLDKGEEVDFIKEKANPNDVSSLLKMFLRELPEPLLTFERYEKWLEAYDLQDTSEQRKTIKGLINSLPHANRVLLSNIIPLLARISMNSAINKMDSGNLSKTVGPNLLWKEGKGDSVEYLVNSGKINQLVQLMIDSYEFYFPNNEHPSKHYATLSAKLFGHKKSIQYLIRGYDENEIWSCDSNGLIRVWNSETLQTVKEIETEQGRIFNISKIGKSVWTTSQKSIKIWSFETKECIKVLNMFAYSLLEVSEVVWIGSEEKITILNSEFNVIKELACPGIAIAMTLDGTGKRVWTGGSDKFLRVWNVQNFEIEMQLKEGHTKRINSFVSVNNQIWSAGEDNLICVWDAEKVTLIKQLEAHSGAVYNVCVCGNYVWSCSWDTSVNIWNTKTFTQVFSLPKYHSDAITSVITLFNKSKKCWEAWTSSWDKSVCIWKIGKKLLDIDNESKKEEEVSTTIDQKMEELNRKIAKLKEKNSELTNRMKDLKEKKIALSQRREKLSKRKQEHEEKKKELQKRKEELSDLQAEMDLNAV